jgi:hypothetical protein
MKRLLTVLACCCLLLLGGCSLTRLAYDHLPRLLRWEAGDYVDLTPQQDRDFKAELTRVWNWHRRTQLPLYAADARGLAAQVQAGPLSLEQVRAFSDRVNQHWDELTEAMVPGYVKLHAELDDAQAAEMIRRIGKQLDERTRKRMKRSEEQRRGKIADDMEDSLHQWIGRLDERQRGMVRDWAAQVHLSTPEEAEQRRGNLDRYAALLATRTQPGFAERVRAFVREPEEPAVAERDRAERERWLGLLSALSATLEPEQREQFRQRLLDYAADFEALAAEPITTDEN